MHTTRKIILSLIVVGCIFCFSFPAAAKDYIYAPVTNACQVIDCETDTVVKSIPYNDYILTSQASPDSKRFYLNAIHSIYAIDTAKNEIVDTFKLSSDLSRVTVIGFAVSHDSQKLYLSCSITKKKQNIPKLNVLPPQLVVFDIKKRKMIKSYTIPYGVMGVFPIKDDPNKMILAGLDIYQLNLKSGKTEKIKGILNPGPGEEAKNFLVIWNNGSPGDHGIFVNPYYTATGMGYMFIDKNNGKISEVQGKDVVFEYDNILSHDKKTIFGVMDELYKIDAKTGETIKMVQVERGTTYALCLTADGKKLYVGPAGADISVYDTETLELLTIIPLEGDGISAHRISL